MRRIFEIIVILMLPSLISYHLGVKNAVATKVVYKDKIKVVYRNKIVVKPVEKIVYKNRIVRIPKIVYREKIVKKPVIKIIYKDIVQKKYFSIENNVPILVFDRKVTATEAIRYAGTKLGWVSPRQQKAIRDKFSDGQRHKISLALRVD